MENTCKHFKFGYCKFKELWEKNHVKEECAKGNIWPEIASYKLRQLKTCKKMIMDSHWRLRVKFAYKHNLIKYSNHEDTNDKKEEGRILQKNVVSLREDITFLIAAKKDPADKLGELYDDFVDDTKNRNWNN